MRINFLNWLNVSGLEIQNEKIKWIYYTYMGNRYRLPVKKVRRGPSKQEYELEEFFSNHKDELYELKGPFGDYHGKSDLIKEIYGLKSLPDNDTVYNPFINMAELLFSSEGQQITKLIREILGNTHFHDFVELTGLNYSRLILDIYNLLDSDLKKLAFDHQTSNKLPERFDFRECSAAIKYFSQTAGNIIDVLKEKKANDENFDVIKEMCKMLNLPESFAVLLLDFIITKQFNAELFGIFMNEMKETHGFDPDIFNSTSSTQSNKRPVISADAVHEFFNRDDIIDGSISRGNSIDAQTKDSFATPSPGQTPNNLTPRTSTGPDLSQLIKEEYTDVPSRESTPELDMDSNGNFVRVNKNGQVVNN